MIINKISNTNFNAKIPLSQYKGPILQLTEEDKKLIAAYEKEIQDLTSRMYKLETLSKVRKQNYNLHTTKLVLNDMQQSINYYLNKIREIKINRFNQQKNNIK